MSKRTRRYTAEFKQEAVKLALNSSSVSSAAKDLGIPEPTLDDILVLTIKRLMILKINYRMLHKRVSEKMG